MRAVAALLMLLAGQAVAQETLPFPAAMLDACTATQGGAFCIGLGAQACVAASGSGSEGVCRGAENAYWSARIAAAEQALQGRTIAVSERATALGLPETSLQEIARGFEAYRTAACHWQTAQWEGMHTGPEEIACLMGLNAHHALWLEARVHSE